MTRSPHRLRRLLQLRRRQEETARVQLAQSLQRAATISDEVRARTEALESVISGVPVGRQRSNLDALSEIAAPAILAAQAAEASAISTAVEIRREWKRAAIRLKGLERLEEKHAEEARQKQARETARDVDDAMTSRFGKDPS